MSLRVKRTIAGIVAVAGALLATAGACAELGMVAVGVGCAALAAGAVMDIRWNRCPYCGDWLGRDIMVNFCPRCGRAIDYDTPDGRK